MPPPPVAAGVRPPVPTRIQTPAQPTAPRLPSNPMAASTYSAAQLSLLSKVQSQLLAVLGPAGLFQLNEMGLLISPQGILINLELLKTMVEAVSSLGSKSAVVWQDPKKDLVPVFQLIERAVGHRHGTMLPENRNPRASRELPLLEHFISIVVRPSDGKITPESAREVVRFAQAVPVAYHEGILPVVVRILNQSSTLSELKRLNDAVEKFQALPANEQAEISLKLNRHEVIESGGAREAFWPAEGGTKDFRSDRTRPSAENLLTTFENLIQTYIAPSAGAVPIKVPRQVAIPVLRETETVLASVLPEQEVHQLISEVSAVLTATSRTGIIDYTPMKTLVERVVSLKTPQGTKAIEHLLQGFVDRNPRMRLLVVTLLKELVVSNKEERFGNKRYREILESLARSYRHQNDPVSIKVRCDAIRIALDLDQNRGRSKEEMEQLISELELVPTLKKLLNSKSTSAFRNGIALLNQSWRYLNPKVRKGFVEVALERASVSTHDSLVAEVINLVLTHLNDVEERQTKRLLEMDLHQATLNVADLKYQKGWVNFVPANDNGNELRVAV